jgi:hypothetical protein
MPFRVKSSGLIHWNGEREVSIAQGYGFEIVHTQTAAANPLEIEAIHQSKIYAKSNHSNFRQRKNRRFIRV